MSQKFAVMKGLNNISLHKHAVRIGVIPTYGLGDLLLSTPAIRNLKEKLPNATVEIFVPSKSHLELLEGNPFVDRIHYFPFLKSSYIEALRYILSFRGKFDITINFYPSNRIHYNLFAILLGAPIRLGHRYLKHDILSMNFLKNRTIKERFDRHVVLQNLDLVKLLGIFEVKEYPLQLFLTPKDYEWAESYLKKMGNFELRICFHPGSSTLKGHINRRWPALRFAQLARMLIDYFKDVQILLFGAKEDESAKKAIIDAVKDDRVRNVETPGIRQAAALIKRCCNVFVTNDSGLMHIAASVGVPVVAIFGPTNYRWVRPWKVRHKVVSLELPCSPCFYYSPKPLRCVEGLDFKCLRELPESMVFDNILEILG